MMAQQKKAMQHLLTYIPPRAGAAADSVLSMKTNHQKNHNTISFITLTSLLSSSLQGTKIARRIRKRSKETNPKTNRLFWLVSGKKNTDRSTTRFQHDWRSLALPSRLKFFTNSYPARVCVWLAEQTQWKRRQQRQHGLQHTVCAQYYTYFSHFIFSYVFSRVCVSGYGMRPPHWLRRFCKDRFGIN